MLKRPADDASIDGVLYKRPRPADNSPEYSRAGIELSVPFTWSSFEAFAAARDRIRIDTFDLEDRTYSRSESEYAVRRLNLFRTWAVDRSRLGLPSAIEGQASSFGAAMISSMMRAVPIFHLHELDLYECDDAQFGVICHLLVPGVSALVHLTLQGAVICRLDPLSHALRGNTSLLSLDLSRNARPFGDATLSREAARDLAELGATLGTPGIALRELSMSACTSQIASFVAAVSTNSSTRSFVFDTDHSLPPSDARMLVGTIAAAGHIDFFRLRERDTSKAPWVGIQHRRNRPDAALRKAHPELQHITDHRRVTLSSLCGHALWLSTKSCGGDHYGRVVQTILRSFCSEADTQALVARRIR